ncbi:MAG: hypothetical protein UY05_C0014G0002 [Candidatus Peregrinibacteria bacterium GW2011_GWA2_47_7]|nr:MAG: hypothetical protein UY05_C0014G0002 [Candidatus Peregrinibacteria bacterium GW2011_GWA2_47_7]
MHFLKFLFAFIKHNIKKVKFTVTGIAVLLVVFVGGILAVHLQAPTIKASNIEVNKNEIASNAPISITFNQLMNRKSVENGFSVFPQVGGRFAWTARTVTFYPEERFKIGESYGVTVPETVTNILGKPLEKEILLYFIVIDPPKVSLAVPNGETNVDSKITVMFDRPMTELTTYDVVEAREFPLKIEPTVEGRFKWIGTSAFQFIPKTRLAHSTKYVATLPAGVASIDGGKLEKTFTFTFQTPRIVLLGGDEGEIYASRPFPLRFNQEVSLESVQSHTNVKSKEKGKIALKASYRTWTETTYDDKGKKHEQEVTDKKTVEIMPAQNDWGYENEYSIEVGKGIAGLEGNLVSETEYKRNFRTSSFLVSYTPSGLEGGESPFSSIILTFDQPIDLGSVRSHLRVEPTVLFSANYGKVCDPKWEPKESPDEECDTIDDFNTVIFQPQQKLDNLKKYTVTLDKNVRAQNGLAYLKENVTWEFTTADILKIIATTPVNNGTGSYRQFCVYSSNPLNTERIEKHFAFVPAVKHALSVNSYDLQYSYGDWVPCKKLRGGERYAAAVSTLLNPETRYSITLKATLEDVFTQKLGKDFTFSYTTEALHDADTGLEIMQKNQYVTATLDQHAAPVFATRNLDEFTIELCRLSTEQFISIDTEFQRNTDINKQYDDFSWPAFEPSSGNCSDYKSVTKKLKTLYWQKQYTEVDLATEFGEKPRAGYYFIRASSPRTYEMRPIYVYDPSKGYSVQAGTKKVFIRPYQILSLTNTHLTVKQSRDTALVWATDVTTGKPINGAVIRFYDYKGAVIAGEGFTDSNGLYRRPIDNMEFNYAVASFGDDHVVTSTNWIEGISPWDFQLGYSPVERFSQGYLYTDRPLYRPTHEVFFKGILRDDYDVELRLPKSKTVDVEILDSRGTSIYKKQHAVSAQGTFGGSIKLDEKAPLGNYSLSACLGKTTDGYCDAGYFSQVFYVEEYRKPEYKLETTFNKEGYVDKEELRAVIDGSYFFGAPVSNGKVSWGLREQNYYFDEYEGEWFSFTDHETFRKCYWGCPYEDRSLKNEEGTLDAQGKMVVTHKIDLTTVGDDGKRKAPDSSKIYTLDATVQDKNNQTVGKSGSVIVHRGEFYVGVKNEDYIVKVGEKMPIKAITVDHKGKPVSGKRVSLELFKLDWKYVKKKNVDGGFYWDNELDEKSIDRIDFTTDGDGFGDHSFKVAEGGEYLVRATGTDSLGNTFSSTVDFYATTSEVVHWKQENNNHMDLKLDQLEYKVGDTAHVLVKSPYQDVKALLTYERGDIMEAKVIDITSNAQTIDVPITEKMIPNFYVSVLEVKGGDKKDPPDFIAGYANVMVNTANKELKISVKTDKERYQPGENVQLEVTTTDLQGKGVPADLSVAAVDASLLALKGNPERDLVGLFYGRRGLGVMTMDNFTTLLERIDLSSLVGSKGGSGKGGDESAKVRGEFEDTAYWRTTLATNGEGKLVTSFKLPDNLTTWNIEVIGSTENSLFGSENKEITTQKPVIVRPVLPRFALFKDKLRLSAIVHNFNKETASFNISIETKNLEIADKKVKTVSIPPGGSEKVFFETIVPKVAHGTMAEVTLSATPASGEYGSDAIRQSFPLYSYSTPETVALSSYTDDVSFTEKVLIPESVDPEFGALKITTGATVATYLTDSLNYLLNFPYGCTEQTLSRLVPNVVLKNAVSIPNLADKIKLAPIKDYDGKVVNFDTVVQKSLQRLYEYQRNDGGWGYFPESKESYPYLTAYMIFGLDQVKQAGYSVDQGIVDRAVAYVRNYMRTDRDLRDPYTGKLFEKTTYWANNRAYMLFVMAETGRGDLGLTNSLYDDRALLSNGGKLYLAMTLHTLTAQSSAKVDELMQSIENQARIDSRGTYVRHNGGSSFDMMTHTKVTALTVQTLNRINPNHPLMPKLIKWLIASRRDGRWATTQDTVSSLIALAEFLEKSKETEADYTAKVKLNGDAISTYTVDAKTILEQKEIVRAVSALIRGEKANEVIFTKDGDGRLYYDMILTYFLPIDEIKPRSEGFNLERRYYRLDDEKLENPVKVAHAGETLKGRLTIVVPEERHLVAVEDFMPAGFELVNFEFETADKRLLSKGGESEERYVDDFGSNCVSCEASYGGYGDYSAPFFYDDGYYYGMSRWTHKEIRDDRLFLFADYMPKGVYEYDYYVTVTSEGKFHHPPAVVSEMYFPENFGRTDGEWMEVAAE